jgi:hypothetical protein
VFALVSSQLLLERGLGCLADGGATAGAHDAITTGSDRHYEQLRVGMQALFNELGIATAA